MTQPTLETRWLMTLQGSIPQPVVISPSLMIFNVLDARIESPHLNAKVLPPSGDWVQVQENGNWKLDVRLLLEAVGQAGAATEELRSLRDRANVHFTVGLLDLIRTDISGRGQVNLLAADKLIQSPRLYATFLLWMLSELYEQMPEIGDPEKPRLVFF